MTQTKGPYYLIIAKYNHEKYVELAELPHLGKPDELTAREKAKNAARELFGYKNPNHDSDYDTEYGDSMESTFQWSQKASYLGAFPYYKTGIDLEKGSHLYGWIVIVEASSFEELKNSELFQRMGYPNSEFCQLFDIHVSPIGRDITPDLFSEFSLTSTELDLDKDKNADAWTQRAMQVYDDQTPAMWGY